ncbi:hypothetical protein [Bremerella sp.]|uniref:hypothetical protein n=1 Tax=Bremerella sp. TaxID=2795602 RepID=UPI0039196FBB
MQIVIAPNGNGKCVYAELVDLRSIGKLAIQRGSNVEPNCDGSWYVDLSPVQGPRVGPFSQRSQALEAERRWLEEHWLAQPN